MPEQVHRQLSRRDGVRGVQVVEDVQLGSAVRHEDRREHVGQLVHLHAQAPRQHLHSHDLRLSHRDGASCRYRQSASLEALLDLAAEIHVQAKRSMWAMQKSRSRDTHRKDGMLRFCTWVS